MTDPAAAAAASSSSPARRRRPPIDLNEPPPPPPPPPGSPSPDARALVTRFHANPAPSPLPAAAHPGEAGVGAAPPCGLCGRPEARGATVVCDACDRGFHVACAGYRPSRPHGSLEDWLCSECCASGTGTTRWRLGKGLLDMNVPPPRPRGLDMNLPPPTDADADAGLELARTSKKCRLNNSLGASSKGFAGPFSQASMEQGRTALESGKCTGIVIDLMKNGFEARQDNGLIISRGFEDPVFASSIGTHSLTNATVLGHVEGELLMQSLREFITERGGILGEGWHVEFKQSISQSDRFAFYCAPDGKKFESIYDVAHYLGVPSSFTYLDMNERVGGYDMRGSLPARRRKKYHAKNPITNGSLEKQDSTRSSCSVDLYSDTEALKPQYGDVRSSASVTKSSVDESGFLGFQDSIVDLPVQYEDFFVISLGKVDLQTSYKDKSQIRPVGYKSCWHDKVTGSLFECEVSNGGESGPVFRVRRCSCSLLPIPNATTFLVHNKTNKADVAGRKGTNSAHLVTSCDNDDDVDDDDDDILMLLLDGNPSELDISSCFSRDYAETVDKQFVPMDTQKQGISTRDLSCHPEKSIESLDMNSSLQDEIGEFYVEGRSSCSVWRMASQTLIDACREVYKQSGRLHFHCEHNNRVFSPKSDGIYVEADLPCSLTKFSCASGPIDTPRVIRNDKELDVSCESIGKWIDQDRFGLDVDFVQEIIENLSGSHAFSRYHTLNDRKDLSASYTVGSGSLLAIQKTEQGGERVAPYSLFRGPTRSSLQDSASKSIDCKPPQGRPLSSRLPAQLVGDVLQILEFLWRFSEVLGLKEPLLFEEIVEELVDPWPCGPEKEIQDYKDPTLHGIESVNGPEPLASEFDPVHGENKMTFVPVETAYLREVTEAKLAACTYGRCHGVILTKIHMSLLKVLIGELLCRVAVFVDPNVDVRETKPRRGRKKDVDNSLLMKETKINILINELSWPELARRYIVAVSSMNGLDSPEVCSRNGVKVFRCLQGDGGVLCGSLSGVSAMEADASMLAEVERQISDPLKREYEVLPTDYEDSVATATCEPVVASNTGPPEWAQLLVPVRKLPTNVGTRIRKCVYEALAKNPPEWARKILEHSISKEVYKGNASGPTKKAVLSVLAEISGGTLQPRAEKKPKQSSPISVPEAIMKRCRIVLRRAMLSDVDKVFCNLLGTTLDNSIDSKDDTVICPPAMVSRPLDFRMIDYRLAVGAYAGSHEAFIEDVREVWHTLRKAYGERPNLLQLVEKLAQNFESLYQEEVLNLFQKFVNHPNAERVDPEAQKELHDILMSSNEIPKAPWEDGVCKVCGIDKDDDSVLLCDTCDSEYHTYCLDPPLARIPKGNWYCSSCLASQNEKQNAARRTQTLRPRSRRGLGVEVRAFQDSLNQLATRMEDGEYWEFSTEERVFLLKFLCDEVLNSVLIHEHMDQCTTEKSNDLQQKLRSLVTDCKNLQVKAELLAMRTVQESANGSRDAMGEVSGTVYADQGKLVQQISEHLKYTSFSGNPIKMASMLTEDRQRNGQNDVCENMDILLSNTLKKQDSGIKLQTFAAYGVTDTMIADCSTHTRNSLLLDKSLTSGSLLPLVDFNKSAAEINELVAQSLQVPSRHIRDEACEEVVEHCESKSCCVETTDSSIKDHGSKLQNLDILQESYMSSGTRRTHLEQNTLPIPMVSGVNMSAAGESLPQNQDVELEGNHYNAPFRMTETVASSAQEIGSLNSEISQLQDSITTLQSQLMMTSFRRDFLGRDSLDRLYWVVGRPGKRPWLVVDGSISLSQIRKNTNEFKGHNSDSLLDLTRGYPVPEKNNFPSGSDAYDQVNSCPSESLCHSSTWVLYESDYEIRELYNWLRDSDPRDRELKENILLWQKFGCHQYSSLISDVSGLPAKSSSTATYRASDCLATKAATILETKYGRWLELEVSEGPKRRGRKAKTNCEDRIYRCECLELVWPSRHHCLSCHQTFCTAIEFEGHNDGRCTSANHAFDESKVTDESLKGKGVRSESTKEKEHFDELHNAETSKSSKLDSSSKLGTPRKKLSPYDIDEVSKKFITNNSNKDLVKEIGLIGSNGIPSFIDSPIFFLDPPVLLNQSNSCNINPHIGYASSDEQMQLCAQEVGTGANTTLFDNGKETASVTMSVQNCLGNDTDGHLPNNKSPIPEYIAGGGKSYSNKIQGIDVCHNCTISESSFRLLVGKISQLLKRLKINLLDMEAALPEEALRPLKAHSLRRCAWRSYVKSAESIFEMVQATILLESMIKTDYLKNGWWYWSSLTAAVKTPTVSSLALRIYSLDDCIIYSKDSVTTSDPIESMMPTNKTGKKRKDTECGS